MGADLPLCTAQQSQQRTNGIVPPTSISDFDILKMLGVGTFAKVYLARRKLDNELYAIKCIDKSLIIKSGEIKHTNDELQILQLIDSPFVVKLYGAFQNNEHLFLVLDYMKGGELFHHLTTQQRFSEKQTSYYMAQIMLGLEELHKHGIIMRDLKPENLLMDENGYLKITDFGLSKYVQQAVDNPDQLYGQTFAGTSEYISCEMLRNQPHTVAIDLWACGIICYELIEGIPPFYSHDQKQMFKMILKSEVKFTDRFSAVSRDFIYKLLIKDPKQRMKIDQAKKHPFFRNIDFEKMKNKEYIMEFKPNKDDMKNFDKSFVQQNVSNIYDDLHGQVNISDEQMKGYECFKGFQMDAELEKKQKEKEEKEIQEEQDSEQEALEQFDDIQ